MTNQGSQSLGRAVLELKTDNEDFNRGLQQAELNAKSATTRMGKSFNALGKNMSDAGRDLTFKVTAPLIGLGALSVKTAIDFESSFAGVRKTVDATEAEYDALAYGIRSMAQEIPTGTSALNEIAEAAGQLGIEKANILGFTRVIADLSETTNLAGQEGATALARFANITGLAQTEFDHLGSTIVALGNNLATTEAEIVAMGLKLSGAGSTIGLTEHQILALGGALSSVGIRAEAGGTAFSRVMISMFNAVETGGEELDKLANVAGMTSEEFARAFKEDAAGALITFLKGLDAVQKSGGNVFAVLEDLGLGEIRVRDALLRTSSAHELVEDATNLASKAWEENTALTKEAALRYGTTASQMEILKNKAADVALSLGQELTPMLLDVLDNLQPLTDELKEAVKWFADLEPETQRNIVKFAALAAAAGPVLFVMGGILSMLGGLITFGGTAAGVIGVLSTKAVAFTLGVGGASVAVSGFVAAGVTLVAIAAAASLAFIAWQTNFNGFRDNMMLIGEAIPKIASAILEDAPATFGLIGNKIAEGIWEGFKSFPLTMFIANSIENLVQGAKGILGIQSPSQVFAGIGSNMMRGIEDGVTRSSVAPAAAIQRAMDWQTGIVEDAVDEAARLHDAMLRELDYSEEMELAAMQIGEIRAMEAASLQIEAQAALAAARAAARQELIDSIDQIYALRDAEMAVARFLENNGDLLSAAEIYTNLGINASEAARRVVDAKDSIDRADEAMWKAIGDRQEAALRDTAQRHVTAAQAVSKTWLDTYKALTAMENQAIIDRYNAEEDKRRFEAQRIELMFKGLSDRQAALEAERREWTPEQWAEYDRDEEERDRAFEAAYNSGQNMHDEYGNLLNFRGAPRKVPGPRGTSRLAVVHGDEIVGPPGSAPGGAGGDTFIFEGDIYGMDQFENRVGEAITNLSRRGTRPGEQ